MKRKYQVPTITMVDVNNEATILSVSWPISNTETNTQLTQHRDNCIGEDLNEE